MTDKFKSLFDEWDSLLWQAERDETISGGTAGRFRYLGRRLVENALRELPLGSLVEDFVEEAKDSALAQVYGMSPLASAVDALSSERRLQGQVAKMFSVPQSVIGEPSPANRTAAELKDREE